MANLSTYVRSLFGGTNTDLVDDMTLVGGVASKSNGQTIAHGLSAAPTRVSVTSAVAKHIASITAISSTTLTIALYDDTGTAVSVAENVYWTAGL